MDYLEGYARHFQLDLRMGQEVTSVRRESDGWRTTTDRATYRSRFVVVATGYTRVPVVPSWPGRERFRGPLVHSSAYQNGQPYRGKRVLVVGFGNSGGEIAIDLHEHGARPALAVRSPVNVIARQVLGVPMVTIGSALRWLPPSVADALGAPISWSDGRGSTQTRASKAALRAHHADRPAPPHSVDRRGDDRFDPQGARAGAARRS